MDILLYLAKPFVFLGPAEFEGNWFLRALRSVLRVLAVAILAFVLTWILATRAELQAPSRKTIEAEVCAITQTSCETTRPEGVLALNDPQLAKRLAPFGIDPARISIVVRDIQEADKDYPEWARRADYEIISTVQGNSTLPTTHLQHAVVRHVWLDTSFYQLAAWLSSFSFTPRIDTWWPFVEIKFNAPSYAISALLVDASDTTALTARELERARAILDPTLRQLPSAQSSEFSEPRRLVGPIQYGSYYLFFIGLVLLLLQWIVNIQLNEFVRGTRRFRIPNRELPEVGGVNLGPSTDQLNGKFKSEQKNGETRADVDGLRAVRLEALSGKVAAGAGQEAQLGSVVSSADKVGFVSPEPRLEGGDAQIESSKEARPERSRIIVSPWDNQQGGDVDVFISTLEQIRNLVTNRAGLMGAIPSIPLLDIKITAFYAMKAARSGESLPSFVTTETEAAAERLEAHHRLVTFIIWAIPTLGFIGTVLGIGQSLLVTLDIQSAFKYLRSTAEGRVATEIGVAFDTTLVALFLSFFLMLAYHLVQRGEDQMLSREKRDALRDLLTINNVRPPPTADDLTDQIARFSHSVSDFTAIQTALARQVQILEVLNKNTDLSIGSRTPKVLIGILVIAVVTTALLVISPDSFRWVFSNMTQ